MFDYTFVLDFFHIENASLKLFELETGYKSELQIFKISYVFCIEIYAYVLKIATNSMF